MNILLIYPLLSRKRALVDENKQFWPPLGLAYLASVLEKGGHTVEILDRDVVLRKNDLDFDKVDAFTLDRIRGLKPGIVGISVTTPNMPDVAHLSRLIKKKFNNTMVVLGGPHVTGEPAITLKEVPEADVIVRGEGELTILELARGDAPEKVKGITYRKGPEIISNAARDLIANIDELPLPARHLLDMKFYTRPSRFTSRNLSLRTTSIFTARGCPYRCSFCAGPLVFSGKVRFHSPERVIREIEELSSEYGVEALYFAEDMFLSSKKRAEELLGLFIERGINKKMKWIAQAKASIISDELLGLMKEAGCVGVEYGFESGSQRVLDLMHKRLKIEESLRAAELTRKARMRFQANIITGYPGETADDFRKTLDFVRKVKPNMIGFNIFMPLPGTPSYEELKREGKELPKWEDIGDQEASQVNYADMPPEMFEKLYLEARLKVILPINLKNFIKDNAKHPLRLAKVGFTQFGGVLVKTARTMSKLVSLNKKVKKSA
jgi:anaerobic magnesium-protoporphyrin IX monomethyl ester cyclase